VPSISAIARATSSTNHRRPGTEQGPYVVLRVAGSDLTQDQDNRPRIVNNVGPIALPIDTKNPLAYYPPSPELVPGPATAPHGVSNPGQSASSRTHRRTRSMKEADVPSHSVESLGPGKKGDIDVLPVFTPPSSSVRAGAGPWSGGSKVSHL
jgi:hypothetical protein